MELAEVALRGLNAHSRLNDWFGSAKKAAADIEIRAVGLDLFVRAGLHRQLESDRVALYLLKVGEGVVLLASTLQTAMNQVVPLLEHARTHIDDTARRVSEVRDRISTARRALVGLVGENDAAGSGFGQARVLQSDDPADLALRDLIYGIRRGGVLPLGRVMDYLGDSLAPLNSAGPSLTMATIHLRLACEKAGIATLQELAAQSAQQLRDAGFDERAVDHAQALLHESRQPESGYAPVSLPHEITDPHMIG